MSLLPLMPALTDRRPVGPVPLFARRWHGPVKHPVSGKMADLVTLRFAGADYAEKRRLLQQAEVAFIDGADYRWLAPTREAAIRQVRDVALKALEGARVAAHDKVKGPLAEGFGAAALVEVPGGTFEDASSNINVRNDIKICAEFNLLDQIIKHPRVYTADNPHIPLMSNILYNFDQDRYHNSHLTPCSLCLDTMDAVMRSRGRLLTPETLMASVVMEAVGGKTRPVLEVRPLKAFMPWYGKLGPSFPNRNVYTLPVDYSPGAQALLRARRQAPITDDHIRDTMQQALAGYAESAVLGRSARNHEYLGVGLMKYADEPGSKPLFRRGSSLHVKNSEFLYPEFDGLSKLLAMDTATQDEQELLAEALQNPARIRDLSRPQADARLQDKRSKRPVAQGLAMVGFIHQLEDQPRPKMLGLLSDAAGGQDFLVGLVQGDVIRVLSSRELVPIQYKDARKANPFAHR